MYYGTMANHKSIIYLLFQEIAHFNQPSRCISKDTIGIYSCLAHLQRNVGSVVHPAWQLRNGISNSSQKFELEYIFKPFGIDGWLKLSYLLDYFTLRCREERYPCTPLCVGFR